MRKQGTASGGSSRRCSKAPRLRRTKASFNEPMIRLSPDEQCPCESGRVLRSCCLTRDGALRPLAALTCPPSPRTGIRNIGCYAAALADCSNDLSREHYISNALLKRLSIDGKVTVDGFPWQDSGATSKVPPASLTGRVLCRRH